ncbi:cysteine desulfurase family protein [Tuberibacillus sp. Marseille-P3662]|uniref:cysteine desulfurase family protein n=1 Tax=Tuberibacillus sp. Marseille-P3662 TaxID=1965358 RepID=UPI000A1CE0F9|nr:cysteine desulfurase family protein [Tuberibacillus sp. Marseille-P3662]
MIYLDNSATTKPYPEVLDTFRQVSEQFFANPSSLHSLGGQSENLLKKARQQAAGLLNVKDSEIMFTSGGTEGNNAAIKGSALTFGHRGRHVITSTVEHSASYESFRQLEQLGFDVTYLPVDDEGRISLEQFQQSLRDDTILVSLIHVNNELGTIQPVMDIANILKSYPKTLLHIDHVQGIGKVPLDLNHEGIDFCTISGHKFHGLKGTGILYVKDGVNLSSLLSGGGQEMGRRAGTENLAGIVALTKALRITLEHFRTDLSSMQQMLMKIRAHYTNRSVVQINTPEEGAAPHILNITVKGIKAEVLIHALEDHDIYISTKSACSSQEMGASRILLASGLNNDDANQAVRISLSYNNTMADMDQFLTVMDDKIAQLQEVMG